MTTERRNSPPFAAGEQTAAFRYARALAYCRKAERRAGRARARRSGYFLLAVWALLAAALRPGSPAFFAVAGILALGAVSRGG